MIAPSTYNSTAAFEEAFGHDPHEADPRPQSPCIDPVADWSDEDQEDEDGRGGLALMRRRPTTVIEANSPSPRVLAEAVAYLRQRETTSPARLLTEPETEPETDRELVEVGRG